MYSFVHALLSLLNVKQSTASALLFYFCKNTNIRKKGDRCLHCNQPAAKLDQKQVLMLSKPGPDNKEITKS